MEQQEEKKIKVYKRQRRRSKPSSSLPLDLTSEILLRLPEKSVVRFRCVSKSWSSITTDPYFINLFKARSPRLLLCFQAKNKLFVSSIPQHHQTFETSNKSYSSSQPKPIDRYHMEIPLDCFFTHMESVQGLICLKKSATPIDWNPSTKSATPIVWNPSTRRLLYLPKPNMSWTDFTIFIGYDPVESKHKVMCTPFSRWFDECKVFTLGSAQESWRTVKTNLKLHTASSATSGRCINGVVYYVGYGASAYGDVGDVPREDVYHRYVLISFDVRSEKFDNIKLPPSGVGNGRLMAYQGRLAWVDGKPNMKNGIRLWILEDAEKHKWSSKDFPAPRKHPDEGLRTYFEGFTHNGEFIYVQHLLNKPSRILFFDPVRNRFRRLNLKGVTPDDERVLSCYKRYSLCVFPNHVESQVSL